MLRHTMRILVLLLCLAGLHPSLGREVGAGVSDQHQRVDTLTGRGKAESCVCNEGAAIADLHSVLDGDSDGVVNEDESSQFLSAHVASQLERKGRTQTFHRFDTDTDDGNDYVSVSELQHAWLNSPVRTWSEEDVVWWLQNRANMPQYVPLFRTHRISGRDLPMLAMSKGRRLVQLGIRREKDAEQLATLVVLEVMFPSDQPSWEIKDLMLCLFALLLPTVLWKILHANGTSGTATAQMRSMREQLRTAQQVLKDYELKVKPSKSNGNRSHNPNLAMQTDFTHRSSSTGILSALEKDRDLLPSQTEDFRRLIYSGSIRGDQDPLLRDLLPLLRQTYEREVDYYHDQCRKAEDSLAQATAEYNKLVRRQKAFMGSMRLAHGVSLESLSEKVAAALEPMEQAKARYTDLITRWRKIDRLLEHRLGVRYVIQGDPSSPRIGSPIPPMCSLPVLSARNSNSDPPAGASAPDLGKLSAPLSQLSKLGTTGSIGATGVSNLHSGLLPPGSCESVGQRDTENGQNGDISGGEANVGSGAGAGVGVGKAGTDGKEGEAGSGESVIVRVKSKVMSSPMKLFTIGSKREKKAGAGACKVVTAENVP